MSFELGALCHDDCAADCPAVKLRSPSGPVLTPLAKLRILYRDDHYVAIDKPAGLLVHRTALANADRFALQGVRDLLGRRVYPIHRLDRPTSGVLVFGLSPEAARGLGLAFQERRVDKRYLAVVRGYAATADTIDYPLQEDENGERRPAVTHYRRLATVELDMPVGRYASARYSLVEANPVSGRRHQLRKHFKHIFHPIVGDTTHGDGRHNRALRERLGVERLLLMAERLTFTHPYSGDQVTLRAPPCPQFSRVLEAFGWADVVA